MKKIHLLIIFSLFISFCSSNDPVSTEIQNEEADTVITFTKGLTKSSSEYVSNWNKLISEISKDE
jgi:hypothetical protein